MKPYFEREQLIWGSSLAPTEKLLLLCLNSFVDGKGECFPGKERLSNMCGVDGRTIIRTVQRLIDAGIVSKTTRRLGSRQQSNLYRVRFSAIPQNPEPSIKGLENQGDNLSASHNSQGDNLSKSGCQIVHPRVTICPSQGDTVSPDLSIDLSIDLSRKKEEADHSPSANALLPESEPVTAQLPVLPSNQTNPDAPSSTSTETQRGGNSPKKEKPSDPMGDRFRAGANPHRYPALVEAGFGAVWVGPGFRDFDPEIVKAACRHKAKNNLAADYVDGQTFIVNAIRDENWAAIEMLVTATAPKPTASDTPIYEVLPIAPIPARRNLTR